MNVMSFLFVLIALHGLAFAERSQFEADCRKKIKRQACVVDEDRIGCIPLDFPVSPLSDETLFDKKYAAELEQVFDLLPQKLQETFCSLRSIELDNQLQSTGFTHEWDDGAYTIGLRTSVIGSGSSAGQLLSWKEQLSFGGSSPLDDSYRTDPNLSSINIEVRQGASSALFFIIVHELAHVLHLKSDHLWDRWLQFSWRRNDVALEREEGERDVIVFFTPSSVVTAAVPTDEVYKHNDLCYYYCDGKFIDHSHITRIYDDLHASSFLNLFSLRNPWEDFAESFTYVFMDRYFPEISYSISYGGRSLDIMEKVRSPAFAEKYQFILEHFL